MNSLYIHKNRTTCIFFCFVILYIFIISYLYCLQIRQKGYFSNLAERQYTTTLTTMPPRAEIFDRYGKALAINKDSVSAFILPHALQEKENVIHFLHNHFPRAAQRLLHTPEHTYFMYVKRHLTPHELDLIYTRNLGDIKLLKEPSRFYPLESLGPVVGITNIDNKGLLGIELQCDSILAGKPSTVFLERDASGFFYFAKELKIAGSAGTSVTLTLDADLQFLIYEELKEAVQKYKACEGCVLIIDPITGHILTMANYPDFDPNSAQTLTDLTITKNKIITDTHEFGSVMKTFLACAAIEEGIVAPDELINCENTKTAFINGVRVNTVHANGIISFSEVIEHSNNIGCVKVALKLGPKLYDHYRTFGFGAKTNIAFPGESKGFINPPARWSKLSPYSLSYGYEITATVLQLGRAFCIIANHGYDVPLVLVRTPSLTSCLPPKQLYSAKTMNFIKQILINTVQQGTARRARINGYTIMGKTGTARLVIDGTYRPGRNIYTFVAIIEKGEYKRVIVTFIKESKLKKDLHASEVAVPLSERVTQKMLIHDKIL